MDGLLLTLGVIGLFLLRVGVPVLVLIVLGYAIDRWQSRREAEIERLYGQHSDNGGYSGDTAHAHAR